MKLALLLLIHQIHSVLDCYIRRHRNSRQIDVILQQNRCRRRVAWLKKPAAAMKISNIQFDGAMNVPLIYIEITKSEY
jgi:hypothetical protein